MHLSVTFLGVALCLSYASASNSIAEQAAAIGRQRLLRGTSYSSLSSTSLLVAEPRQLSKISLDPPSRKLIERTPNIGGLDYHVGRNRVYWSEISTGRINALNLTGPTAFEAEPFFELSPLEWRPRAIAIDFVSDKLYVLDSRGKRVHVLDLANKRRSVIFEGQLQAPTDIAIDPKQALMFIADGTRVLRFNMDGSELKPIIEHPRYRIKAITLDPKNQRIFWSDVAFHRIKSANYEGEQVQVLVKNHIGRDYSVLGPAQLSYYNDTLYFYDDVYRSISALKLDDEGVAKSGESTTMLYDRVDVKAIKVLNLARQSRIDSSNPCEDNNAGCEHICLIAKKLETGIESKCACDVGKKLAEDGKSCL